MLEQKFKPNKEKLNLTDIEIDISKNSPQYSEDSTEVFSQFPHVFYNNYKIEYSHVTELTIKCTGFLPVMTLKFIDIHSVIYKYGLPMDDSRIKIMWPSNNKALGNVIVEFKIESYDVNTKRENLKEYVMTGMMSINSLLIPEYKTYKDMSSYEVFESVAKNTGLGFVSNISSTNDKMTWNNFGIRNIDFLKDVQAHAWIGETNFLWCYVDLYYNLNFVDVEAALAQNIKEIVWSFEGLAGNEHDPNNSVGSGPAILTNSGQYRTSNIYVSDYTILNDSTNISLESGYTKRVHFYDIDGNWSERSGYYHKYDLDTITSSGDTKIILKSDDTEFLNKNTKEIYSGIIDTKNMHQDFLWAQEQNKGNIAELEKFIIQLNLPKVNFNIKRFEKLQFQEYDNNMSATNVSNNEEQKINTNLSGNYLVTGFELNYGKTKSSMTVNTISREIGIPE